MGLNSSYAAYKQYYEDGLKNWSETLSDAFTEAAKYKPRATGSGNPSDMGCANAFTMRGRGKGRGRGTQGEDVVLTTEQGHLETILGRTVGFSLNIGPGREDATHMAIRDITLLNLGPKTLKAARRWVLGVHSWSRPVMGRESKCFT
jgi:hypothetical protein